MEVEGVIRQLRACKQGNSDHLFKSLEELLIHERRDLMPQLLPELLQLEAATGAATRKGLAGILEAAGLADSSLLVSILPALTRLLSDAQPSVIKRTLQAGRLLMPQAFKEVLQDISSDSPRAAEQTHLWQVAQKFKDAAVDVAAQHPNDGVRLYGVKFLEALIFLYTPDPDTTKVSNNGAVFGPVHAGLIPKGHPLLDPSQLGAEATRHLASLLSQLRGPAAHSLPKPAMLVLISSLTAIARQRLSFFGRILPVLLSLAQPSADPGPSTSGGDTKPRVHPPSILHALKTAYVALVRLQDASAAPWRDRLIACLRKIGAHEAANAEEKKLGRQSQEPLSRKRGATQPQSADSAPGGHRSEQGPEGGLKRVKTEGGESEPEVKAGPPAPATTRGVSPIHTMLSLVCQLAARTEPEAQAKLRQLVDQMPISMLVDLVMASMKNDPMQKLTAKQEAVKTEADSDRQAPHSPRQATPPLPPGPPPVKRETIPPSALVRTTPPKQSTRLPTPPLVSGPIATSVGDGKWSVVPLSTAQKTEQARGAIHRVVKAGQLTRGSQAGQLRAALIGRMLAQAEEDLQEGRLEEVVAQLFSDAVQKDALEVALQWLYCTYALHQEREDSSNDMQTDDVPSNALTVLDDEADEPPTYQTLLLALARATASRLPPTDRSFQRLLCDAPALPPSILALLQGMLEPPPPEADPDTPPESGPRGGGYLERVTQSLSALWALIMHRPLVRTQCLDIALRCTVEHPHEEVRSKAIRLVANKLYPLPYCRDAIRAMAREQLELATQEETPLEEPTPVEEDSEEARARLERAESGREAGTSAEAAKQRMSLFFGLCYKSSELLPELVARYGRAGKGARQAILRQVPLLLKSVGPSSPPLLSIIDDPPPGVEPLLLQILSVLTENAPPSEDLIQRVKKLYATKLKDARLLIPILSFMSKDEARSVFPALVSLPLPQFKLALNRLLQGSAATGPALTPPEVLVALHEVEPKRDGVPLKKVTDACTACMAQRTVFTPQVLATTLNQLVERSPIPLLFMRTVLQGVGAFPSLKPFVVELLGRLVRREIWSMPQLWLGFLKAAHHTVPESLPVLLQLPSRQVAEVVTKNPDLKPLLAAHVTQTLARTALPRSTLVVLGLEKE